MVVVVGLVGGAVVALAVQHPALLIVIAQIHTMLIQALYNLRRVPILICVKMVVAQECGVPPRILLVM